MMRVCIVILLLAPAALFVLTGCEGASGLPPQQVCDLESTQNCICSNGNVGVQECNQDGSGWSSCFGCPDNNNNSNNNNNTTDIVEDPIPDETDDPVDDVVQICTPMDTRGCSCMPRGTGFQSCNAQGTAWSDCQGCPGEEDVQETQESEDAQDSGQDTNPDGSEEEPNNDFASSNGIQAPSDNMCGHTSTSDDDYFWFSLNTRTSLKIETYFFGPTTADTEMWLYNSEGQEIAYNDNYPPDDPHVTKSVIMSGALSPGSYTIRIRARMGDGDYCLRITETSCIPGDEWCEDDIAKVCNDRGDNFRTYPCYIGCSTMPNGHGYCDISREAESNNEYSNANEVFVPYQGYGELSTPDDIDWYWFTLDETETITIEVRAVAEYGPAIIGTRMWLINEVPCIPNTDCPERFTYTCNYVGLTSACNEYELDQGGGWDYGCFDDRTLQAGTYHLAINSSNEGETGYYGIIIQRNAECVGGYRHNPETFTW